MKQRVMRSLFSRTFILGLALGTAGAGFAQVTPTPAAPAASSPAAAASPDMASSVMEPVRKAIGDQDYEAASRALEAIRQQDPNNPHISVYESIINARQAQPSAVGLRTPRAGYTPGPTPEVTPTPTPAPTPVATPATAPDAEAQGEGLAAQAEKLLENKNVLYGLIGLAVLIVLGIIFMVMKKRKAAREMEEPIAASTMGGAGGLGGMEDYSGAGGDSGFDPLGTSPAGGGLGGSPLAGDYNSTATPSTSAYGSSMESPEGSTGSGLGGGALGGGGLAGYTVPTFGNEEEESAPPPPQNLRPAPTPEEDDRPVSLTDDDDEPQAPAPSAAPEQPSPLAGADSGEGLGVNFDALAGVEEPQSATPPPADFARPDDDTVMVTPPESPIATPTPTGGPTLDTGAVDLSDIFGEQEAPQENVPFSDQPTLIDPTQTGGDDERLSTGGDDVPFSEQPTLTDDDVNSQTLPTFVSAPGAENPEEEVQLPPKPQKAPKTEDDTTISFEELFGAQGMPAAEPEPAPAPVAETKPEPAPAQPASDISIEDALAATLGAMQAESPDNEPTPAASLVTESTESLDERSERMFREQMDKARKAYEEKNWRQAVHFLSIASALHPENEEAKQMLKEARTEKRKAEESV